MNKNQKILILQTMLATISEFYDNIPSITPNGTFDPNTKKAIIEFQKANNLTPNGIVDKNTWNEIYRKFIGITDIFFLKYYPAGIKIHRFGGKTLKLGSKGEDVEHLQQYLNTLSLTNPDISPIPVTGIYNQRTMSSVMQYQKLFNLDINGEVDKNTWNSIVNTYKDSLYASLPSPKQYPGHELKLGDKDDITNGG